ncbi:MAG: tetratricopeptide repeat protein [Planctomycetaceae bacterium]
MQKNVFVSVVVLLASVLFSGLAWAQQWEAVKLKSGSVSYGRISGDSISVEGKFTDTSRTYEVLEQNEKFVRITDGTHSGWCFKISLTPVSNPVPGAPATPDLWQRTEAAQRDPLLGTRVFWKDGGVAKVGSVVVDLSKNVPWPATVEDVQGDWLWLGRAWMRRSDVMTLNEAFDHYVDEVRRNPGSAQAWRRRAGCWAEKGELTNAIKDYDEAIRLDPKESVYHNLRGIAKWNLDDYAGAIKDFDEAIRLDPKSSAAYNNRGFAKRNLKDYEGAIKDHDEAIRLDPKSSAAYNNRGNAKSNLKDYAGAIRDYDEAIRLDPKSAVAYNNRGNAKNDLKDYAGAIKDYDEAIQLDPKYSVAYYNRGLAKGNLKDYEGAIKDYDEAIRLDPKDSLAYDNRGWTKLLARQYEAALPDFDEAIRLNPKSRNAYNNKSLILAACPTESLRDAEAALQLAEQALELDPDNAYAFTSKACALALQGDFTAAIECQNKARSDADWMKDEAIDGGVLADERIKNWQAQTLWLLPE